MPTCSLCSFEADRDSSHECLADALRLPRSAAPPLCSDCAIFLIEATNFELTEEYAGQDGKPGSTDWRDIARKMYLNSLKMYLKSLDDAANAVDETENTPADLGVAWGQS
jgi:hypothetical protein